ncbi:DNA polymerase IV [Alkalicoccobacillus plakortidis]|uniref:DNA polymerase IV n=1 Tax=Alkalicoccobacillus plakortidis TaxID=444060 RepID=A0ABT0XG68_9BACI|nr:DNA polymerase IV [Alkalicoccobacillus plakortidis]MCM2674888.1 DNA polymerase IV [Alkalicoccobacillus plakortidis]
MKSVIFLVDMESFYASIEVARRPEYKGKALVVSGDPNRRSGVILAASKEAKYYGVKNAERLWEAKQKCNQLIIVPPHMQDYIEVSMEITSILKTYTDLVEPYSIDEQFMDVTNSQRLFGSPLEIAKRVQTQIWNQCGVRARVGIGENKILAKLACDHFAKKNAEGIYELKADQLQDTLWPLPVEDLFGVGSQMKRHLYDRGIRTIGQLAATKVEFFKKRWGIHGQVLWMNAHGVDYSPVKISTHDGQKAIGHGMTLPYDYAEKADIHIVLLELCEEVCQRARKNHVHGSTVSLSVSGASYEIRTGFHRQFTMPYATNAALTIYKHLCQLLDQFWDGKPVRRLGISLSSLSDGDSVQLDLFEHKQQQENRELGEAMDLIKARFGKTALLRASSLLPAGQARERAAKIGGHYK